MFNIYWKCLWSDGKDPLVREERGIEASGLSVV